MNLKWSHPLSSKPLCVPPETCSDQYMVNAVAVSDSGTRAVGATYYQNYDGTTRTRVVYTSELPPEPRWALTM